MYNSGVKQLDKGKAFFEKVLAPLSGVQPENWKYKGMVFFPNIDDRDFFMSLKDDPFTEEEIKVSKKIKCFRTFDNCSCFS